MLALSRGEGQSIIIDGRIEVKIVKWSRSSVRLAIQAPREVTVDRDEIWRRMHPGQPTPLELVEQNRHPPSAGSPPGPASPTVAPGAPAASLPPSGPATGPSAAPETPSPTQPPTPPRSPNP